MIFSKVTDLRIKIDDAFDRTKKVSAPIVGIGVASAKAASDFEKHFAKLLTIADASKKTGVSINDLKKQLRGLSEETGKSQSDLAEDTYKKLCEKYF